MVETYRRDQLAKFHSGNERVVDGKVVMAKFKAACQCEVKEGDGGSVVRVVEVW